VGPSAGVGGGVPFTPLAVGLLGVDVNLARAGGSSWRRLLWLGLSRRGVANLRLVAYAGAAVSLGAFLGARLGLFLAGVEGGCGGGASPLGGFCLVGWEGGVVSAACRRARCPAWVCGGAGVVGVCGEVRRWADGVGLAAVFGVGLVSGVFGVGAGGRWFRCLTW